MADENKKAWLTTWTTSGGPKGRPRIAMMTIKNIGFGMRSEIGSDGLHVSISPMSIEELNIIRKALNKYFKENKLTETK